jgi:hypothetical protein
MTSTGRRNTANCRAFDLFEGYAVSGVLAAFEMAGLLADLRTAVCRRRRSPAGTSMNPR